MGQGVRWIVTGSQGQLGRCLVEELTGEGGRLSAWSRADVDLADADALEAALRCAGLSSETTLINAAAHTAVDRCESEEALAGRINSLAPERMARACRDAGARFVHVSTDYVFDGDSETPYREDHDPAPRSAYGRTKLAGEQAVRAVGGRVLIVRTSWVFGPGRNFVAAILRQAQLRRSGEVEGPLVVVDDQRGCPTYAADLARGLRALVERDACGIFHLSNREPTTWWGFARAILDDSGYDDLEIRRGHTSDLDLPAPRPAHSVLDCTRAAQCGVTLRPWREALRAYLDSPAGRELRKGQVAA